MISQVDSTAVASKIVSENDRKNLMAMQMCLQSLLATPLARDIEVDEDALDQPARKKVKTSNSTSEAEDTTMLL